MTVNNFYSCGKMSVSWRQYFDRERLNHVASLSQDYKWYIASSAVAGYLMLRWINAPRNLPPGPKGWPVIGNAGDVCRDWDSALDKWSSEYGNIFCFRVFGRLVVVLNSPGIIREAMIRHNEEFGHKWMRSWTTDISFNDDLLSKPYNEKWKNARKLAMVILRTYGFGTLSGERKILDTVTQIKELIRRNGSACINPKDMCNKAAANIFLALMFNTNYQFNHHQLTHFIATYNNWMIAKDEGPLSVSKFLPTWVKKILFKVSAERFSRMTGDYEELLLNYVNVHNCEFDRSNPQDTVDGYLLEKRNEPIEPLVIAHNIMAFSSDGIWVMSSVFRGILFYLAKYPDVQRRVQTQLDSVISSTKVTMKDKTSLPLVDAVICESLRLQTPVSVTSPRVTPNNLTIAGYNIPKGSITIANIKHVHMNNISNPDHFDVEHFLNEKGRLDERFDPLMAFGIGRRMCIGEQLAKMELFLLVSNILLEHSISFPPGFAPPEDTDLITDNHTRKHRDFNIVFKQRRHWNH